MADLQSQDTDRAEARAQTERGSAEAARERLLSGLPVSERRMQLAGISSTVLEGGDGSPVVLLHGALGHALNWLRVLPELVTMARVIAPDLPGHGASAPPEPSFAADRVFAWLADLIDRTSPTPPVLVGNTLGGAIAARFAIERGDRIRGLVLVGSLGLADFQPAPEFAQALGEFLAELTADAHDRLWMRCAFDLDVMRERLGDRWAWLKAYDVDRARAPALRSAQQALMDQFGMRAIPPADLARIPVRTRLIWGRNSLACPLSVAQTVGSSQGWRVHVIENAGDEPAMEQPDAFVEALRAALGE